MEEEDGGGRWRRKMEEKGRDGEGEEIEEKREEMEEKREECRLY